MDSMSYRNNRPAARPTEPESRPTASPQPPADPQPTPAAQPSKARRSSHESPKPKRKFLLLHIALVIALLLAVAGWFFVGRSSNVATAIDGGKYQAVFFTNGQVYFGKLASLNGEYMSLKSVYYLQNKSDTDDDSSPQSTKKQDSSDMELIKLGNEVHGPEDEMIIAKNQILFFENLKPEGTVSKTISEYLSKSN